MSTGYVCTDVVCVCVCVMKLCVWGGGVLFGVFLRLERLGYCASVRALWAGVVACVFVIVDGAVSV